MASPNTLQLRELGLPRQAAAVLEHNGPNRAQRRAGATGPANTPWVGKLARIAPQLTRRDRRIAARDATRVHASRGQSANNISGDVAA